MTIEAVLATLAAGLAEDEAIARAARGDVKTWVLSDDEVFAVYGALAAEGRCDQHERGVPNMCDDLPIGPDSDFDSDGTVAAQMVRQQPRRTLAQVEAIRRAIEESQRFVGRESSETGDVGYEEYVSGHTHACERILSMLAGVYTEAAFCFTAAASSPSVPH